MITECRLNLELHGGQNLVHKHPARFKVVKTGKKWGKSFLAQFKVAKWALLKPNSLWWYTAPTYGQAKDIGWRRGFLRIIPREFIEKSLEQELRIELINGSTIQLKGTDNEEQLRGPNLDGVAMDEAAYSNEYVWTGILRSQLAASRGPALFISSPNRKGRNWFTSFGDQAKLRMLSGDPDWGYWHYTIHDNPTLSAEEIEQIRANTPDDTWNLEYMAEESDYAGQLYGEFSEKSLGEPSSKYMPIFRGLDWGISHPTVCLWAKVDLEQKRIYIYDEFVKSGLVIQESCSQIRERTGELPVEFSVIDPSTAKRNSQTGRSDSMEFARYGITCVMGDNRDRGYDIVKMFLKRGLLIISPKCKNLISEIKNLQRGDTENDDCTDALRYLVLRIHDYINGMNIFENGKPLEWKPSNPREMNMYDLFPKKEYSQHPEMNWLTEEAV